MRSRTWQSTGERGDACFATVVLLPLQHHLVGVRPSRPWPVDKSMPICLQQSQRMPQLRKQFEKEFSGKTLQGVIKKECAGDFEAALVSLAAYTPPRGVEPLGPDDEVPGPPVVQEAAPAYAAPPPPSGYPGAAGGAPPPREDSW